MTAVLKPSIESSELPDVIETEFVLGVASARTDSGAPSHTKQSSRS